MALTRKDLQIINAALAYYQSEIDDEDGSMAEFHKESFGNPVKTVEATRNRVFKEMAKREGSCV